MLLTNEQLAKLKVDFLELHKDQLTDRVINGTLDQESADFIEKLTLLAIEHFTTYMIDNLK